MFERLIGRIDADRYIVDGNLKLNVRPDRRSAVTTMVRATSSQPAVSAASIIAKVARPADGPLARLIRFMAGITTRVTTAPPISPRFKNMALRPIIAANLSKQPYAIRAAADALFRPTTS